MAHRRAHKKLRAEIRARMAKTGESYQAARQRIVDRGRSDDVDLVPCRYFGVPMTLATAAGPIVHFMTMLPSTAAWTRARPLPLARWLLPRRVN